MSKNLGVWQFVSLASRFLALALGLVQSVIIARILSVSEFGIIGLVGAIGAIAGIAQHLGLASGTTREISATSDKSDIFKIFISSVVIKYVIVFPIALSLFLIAPYLSDVVYKNSELLLPIRLYSLVLVVQGVQSIFNSVIAGLQKFKSLFIYQSVIALVSVLVYIPLVFFYRVTGYFYALVMFNVVATATLSFLALYPIRQYIHSPSQKEFRRIFRNVFVLSIAIYVVKVFYTVWFKFGQLSLGYFNALESVGIFSFALLYSSKLQTISDALTDVNLPVFSKEFSEDPDSFKRTFKENFNKLFFLILIAGVSAIFFSREFILFAVGTKYEASLFIIPPLVLSFVFYSYMNILKSSVLIPTKMVWDMILAFALMLFGTFVSFVALNILMGELMSLSFGMFAGALLAFFVIVLLIKRRLNFFIFGRNDLFAGLGFFLILAGHFLISGFFGRSLFFVVSMGVLLVVLDRSGVLNVRKLLAAVKR